MQYASDVFSYLEDNLTRTLQAVRDNGDALKGSDNNGKDKIEG